MDRPEPETNPNPSFIVDPPWLVRRLISMQFNRLADPKRRAKKRAAFEAKRAKADARHRVDYFHQLDDPYAHLTAQVITRLAARYDVDLIPHLVRAAGGKDQPEQEKLAVWARRDCALIAPHYGLTFPDDADTTPPTAQQSAAANLLADMALDDRAAAISALSDSLWRGDYQQSDTLTPKAAQALDEGSALLSDLGHYSGATFHYGGEFYWGVDRLFHLEQRLMDLGLRRDAGTDYLVPRPGIDVSGVDASTLELTFYPSLNSPYTSIIFDRTVALAAQCKIRFKHKPVLPMVMRGVPASRKKGSYIVFDTKREADHLGVPFAPVVMPIGAPTRDAYSLLAWAKAQGKDVRFMSALLRLAFAEGVSLANSRGMRKAIEQAGLDWTDAKNIIGNQDWHATIAQNQHEMVDGMGLWGVPCFKLAGPNGEPDLMVWGQDRLWLVAAEIRRRAHGSAHGSSSGSA